MIAAVLCGLAARSAAETFTLPAEFEPQDAVWMVARPFETEHPTFGVVTQMIAALAPHVRVEVLVADDKARDAVRERLAAEGVDAGRVAYWVAPATRWIRDVGALFLRGDEGSLRALDFDFNCYGECEAGSEKARLREGLDRLMAGFAGVPVMKAPLVGEHGGREVNGRGTLIAVEAVELHRNPGLSRDEIERRLLAALGQKKVIWLKRGIAEDDKAQGGPLYGNVYPVGTGGHVDEFCRFAGPRTILLAEVSARERDSDPVLAMSHARLEEAARLLARATDQDGRKFQIVRVPVADLLYEDVTLAAKDVEQLAFFHGSRPGIPMRKILAASYLNFLVSNGVVLAPAYWREGRPASTKSKDAAVRAILARAFAGRRVVPIHSENFNHGGGGIHCATLQQPAVVPPRP